MRQPLRRRSARRASDRRLPPPQQHAAQADVEMLPDVEMRDAAEHRARAAHGVDALAGGIQLLASDAALSAETGDDVASVQAQHGDFYSEDSEAGQGLNWGPGHMGPPFSLTPPDPKAPRQPLFLEVIRPGTVLCNGAIELPANMAIRVTASCTLRGLRLRGPGVATEEYWGYAYPGLVSVIGDPAASAAAPHRIRVTLTGLELRRAGCSNGIKVAGAADVTISHSSICNCRRNGIIVQGPGARATLHHTKSFQNEASGLWVTAQGRVSASHCYFGDNRCNGAACWDAASSLAAFRCVFQNNAANGVRYLYGATGALQSCTVAGNQEQGLEAGEAATAVRVCDSTLTGNQNWAVKTYRRAAVFLRDSSVNRGHVGALSVHASGDHTSVCASDCDFGGSFHVQHQATFSRLPEVPPPAA